MAEQKRARPLDMEEALSTSGGAIKAKGRILGSCCSSSDGGGGGRGISILILTPMNPSEAFI